MSKVLVSVFLYLLGVTALSAFSNERINTKLITTAERIRTHGYPAEEHFVKTTDGYVLQLFRIPGSNKHQDDSTTPKPAVLLQHGLLSCSDMWIAVGPNSALPFMLADLGYDVWLGNARGNIYSRQHTTVSSGNPKFWRFSLHEIGVYDLSAMIDNILEKTDQKALHYVGHSQGTTAFFVLMSMIPSYNEKIKTSHMLAPIGYMNHMTDKLVTTLAPHMEEKGFISDLLGSAEFFPRNKLFLLLDYNMCGSNTTKYSKLCSEASFILGGGQNSNMTSFSIMAETHPAGSSTDQILHYMQEFNSGHFRQFDFGEKKNNKRYKQPNPPDYVVEQISSDVFFYYSDNDSMAAVEDVERFSKRLPNLKAMHHVPIPTWTHSDFCLARDVKNVINDVIINEMQIFEAMK